VVRRSITELCVADHRGDAATIAAWLENKTEPNFRTWIDSARHVALAAEQSGRVVGFGLLRRPGFIDLLYVVPDARFQGVSKALLAAMEEAAQSLGVDVLNLNSSATAKRFYECAGYVAAGDPTKGFGCSTCYPMSKRLVR
jgi:GNAT superfamily N-acetyltransferase